jgi:hypothetical protein
VEAGEPGTAPKGIDWLGVALASWQAEAESSMYYRSDVPTHIAPSSSLSTFSMKRRGRTYRDLSTRERDPDTAFLGPWTGDQPSLLPLKRDPAASLPLLKPHTVLLDVADT